MAAGDAENGAEVVLATTGVFALAKVGADSFTVGETAYWDDSAKLVTATATSNTRIGVAVAAADNTMSTVDVRLHGAW